MKKHCILAAGLLLCAASLQADVYDVGGFVYCDANQNGQIDSSDTPMPGVLVMVVNASGSFINSNWTEAPDGGWVIEVPTAPDTYTISLHAATLPSDATVDVPSGGKYTFSIDATHTNFLGNFLIKSATCASSNPPPPPPPPKGTGNTNCCLKAQGMIRNGPGMPAYVLAGSAIPGCGSSNGDGGEWELLETSPKLHFKGSVFQITNCGQDTNSTTGDVFSFIEFQGLGTLKGVGHHGANYGVVSFNARAEDYGKSAATPDQIYFRVYASDGTTLLLLGGDAANPQDVVPIPLSKGKLRIGTSCCSKDDDGDEDDNGSGEHHGGHKVKGNHGHDGGNHGDSQGKSGEHHGNGEHGHGG